MHTDPEIVRIAERRQHVVTNDDLERLGHNIRSAQRRVAEGSWRRLANGIYAIAIADDPLAQWRYALCLSDDSLVLSHSTAAAIWGLRRAPKDLLEVTVPTGHHLRGSPAVIHRSNLLPQDHVVELPDGIRVTSVARTVFDLGGTLDIKSLRSIAEDARNRQLCTDDELGDVYKVMLAKGRRGSGSYPRIADLVDRVARPTMSELELVLHDALVAAGLPAAVQQHPVRLPNRRLAYLDLAYPECRLDIEVDHSTWHSTVSAVESDKARDLGLAVLGWERLRFTERAMENVPSCVHYVRTVRHRLLRQTAAA